MALGRVIGAHGLRGQLRVRSFGGDAEPLLGLERVALGEREEDPEARWLEVERAVPGRSGEVRMALRELARREDAEALRGRLLLVRPEQLEPLPPGEYYGFQLIGCRVEADDAGEIGVVRDIWETGAADLLVLEGPQGEEILIPAVESMLRTVDPEVRHIQVTLPPGLLTQQRGRS